MSDFTTLSAIIDTELDPSGRIGRLTLEQPDKLNPLGSRCLTELAEAARWFDSTDATVVIVAGRGRAFSAGFDLREYGSTPEGMTARQQNDLGRLMADAVERMTALTIASISGPCVGGGFVLASCCDFRMAADDTTFVIPEVDLGIPLTWGAIPRLVRELPAAIVRDWVITCRPFDADEAARIGFVNRAVALGELGEVTDELARSLARKAPSVLRASKRQINEALDDMATTAGAWAEVDLLGAAMADPDARAAAEEYLAARRR